MRVAAIDIGTVTCRMLVADMEDGILTELTREYAICNLGEGVDATGELKPEAMQRVASAVDSYLSVLEGYRDEQHPEIKVVTMATSASRDAKNADEFASLLASRGITLSVIPGEKEAALSFRGAAREFAGESIAVADIGGGSTEIVAGIAGCDPELAHSFNIGCRRMTERCLHSDPPTKSEIDAARAWAIEEMSAYADGVKAAFPDLDRLVAVAGTATSVVSMYEEMAEYDSSRVNNYVVTRDILSEVFGKLSAMTLEERARVVGLDPGRAPVILAGFIILDVVMDRLGVDSYTVSENDILHGIVMEAAAI